MNPTMIQGSGETVSAALVAARRLSAVAAHHPRLHSGCPADSEGDDGTFLLHDANGWYRVTVTQIPDPTEAAEE